MTFEDECWGHHCVSTEYGVDHGDNLLLHKSVLRCSTCGTSQLEILFAKLDIMDIENYTQNE